MLVAVSRILYNLSGKKAPKKVCIVFNVSKPSSYTMSLEAPEGPEEPYLVGTTIVDVKYGKKQEIRMARWNWLRQHNLAFDNPEQNYCKPKEGKNRPQLFGSCAETYALVIKLL